LIWKQQESEKGTEIGRKSGGQKTARGPSLRFWVGQSREDLRKKDREKAEKKPRKGKTKSGGKTLLNCGFVRRE
jgi:hypothetical protein